MTLNRVLHRLVIFKKFAPDQLSPACDYEGVTRLTSCPTGCCRRWYITINAKECLSPAPIDTVIYASGVNNLNLHRPGTLDGFCNNIPAGRVTVGL